MCIRDSYYALSFFARGEGSQVGLNATVTFLTPSGSVSGGTLTVRQQDMSSSNRVFIYYQLITTAAPADATSARIDLASNASGSQAADLDDVSFLTL